jgi:hypothetical protein
MAFMLALDSFMEIKDSVSNLQILGKPAFSRNRERERIPPSTSCVPPT